MKNQMLLLVFSFLILTSACRTEGNLMLRGDASDRDYYKKTVATSFVQLKNGKRLPLSGSLASELTAAVREPPKPRKVNDTTIRSNDIMSVVTPDHWSTVVSINKKGGGASKDFAGMKFKGPRINYYSSSSSYTYTSYNSGSGGSGFSTSSGRSNSYYIQLGDSGALKRFDYQNLRKMIPKTDPASRYLVKYRTNKTINNTVRWAGLGLFAVGVAFLCSGEDPYSKMSAGMIPAGIGVLTFGGIMQSRNIKRNLHRAFYMYNGVSSP